MPLFDEEATAKLNALIDHAADTQQKIDTLIEVTSQNTKDISALRAVVEGTHKNVIDVLEVLKLHINDPDAHTRENP